MSDETWLKPLDCRIEKVRKETAAIKKETARLQAWKEYCEASLDLSNQEDVGEEQEADEYGYPLKLGDFYVS